MLRNNQPPRSRRSRNVLAIPKSFLARGSLGSLGIKIITVGLAFVTQLLLARLMGAGQYGVYVYALTWLNALGLFARLGTDGLLTRFAAAYVAEGKWALLRGLVRFGYRSVGLASLGFGLVALAAIWALRVDLGPDRYSTFLAALVLLPISTLWSVGQSLLFGLKRPWRAQLPEPISRLLMLPLIGAVYWHFGTLSAVPTMLCGAAAGLAALVLGTYWLRRALPRPLSPVAAVSAAGDWFAVAMPMLLMAFLRMLLSQSDILLIGWLLNDAGAAGIYAVATRLAELTTFGLQAANTTLAPTIAELHATRQHGRLQDAVTRSTRAVFAFTVAASLGLALFGEPILAVFGPEFTAAYPPLLILLAGQTVNAATGSVGYLMTMTGHQREAAWLVAIAGTLTVALNFTLIPRFGIQGAAIANATGMSLVNLAMLAYVGIRLKINSTVFRRMGYGPA